MAGNQNRHGGTRASMVHRSAATPAKQAIAMNESKRRNTKSAAIAAAVHAK